VTRIPRRWLWPPGSPRFPLTVSRSFACAARSIGEDELVEHWTLVGEELVQVAGKRGATRLGFALLLKFYAWQGRFPRGRGELPDDAVSYVARQVEVPAADAGLYEWEGRTVEYHRAQVRRFFGFRECTVADAEKLMGWLAEQACQRERRSERVREELLRHLREERIEPPAAARLGRIIGSAVRQAEQALTARISGRIPAGVVDRMLALIADASDDPAEDAAGEDRAEDRPPHPPRRQPAARAGSSQ